MADAAETHAGFAAGCPGDRRQHYLRLDIALAAGRGDREGGLALFEELLTTPMLYDAASTINSVFVLVEDLLSLGVTPAEVRSRVFDGWLAEHPSNATFAAHADGLLALAAGDHERAAAALSAVLVEPDPCLAKPGHRIAAHGAGRGVARGRRPGRGARGHPPGDRRRPGPLARRPS